MAASESRLYGISWNPGGADFLPDPTGFSGQKPVGSLSHPLWSPQLPPQPPPQDPQCPTREGDPGHTSGWERDAVIVGLMHTRPPNSVFYCYCNVLGGSGTSGELFMIFTDPSVSFCRVWVKGRGEIPLSVIPRLLGCNKIHLRLPTSR